MAARMNISVQDDLKRRMDDVTECVNWSSMAAGAFEIMLGQIAARKERKVTTDVIQRLRASKVEGDSDESRVGYEDGHRWATHQAQYSELKALTDQRDLSEGLDWGSQDCDYGPRERFYFCIRRPDDGNRDHARAFWAGIDASACSEFAGDDALYVTGFSLGALAVWDKVEKEL